jgi:hypothetical protein
MPGSVNVVDKVAVEQTFIQALQFYPVNIIPAWLSTLIYHLVATVQRHSLTPIDMNNKSY